MSERTEVRSTRQRRISWRYRIGVAVAATLLTVVVGWIGSSSPWALLMFGLLVAILVHDTVQRRHAVLRIYPLVGHARYVLEDFRHQVRQYFIQSDQEAEPYTREQREIVYQRAKGDDDSHAFGTQLAVYQPGYEWINHDFAPLEPAHEEPRLSIGGPHCTQPYAASRLNISGMSYGALGSHAVMALNRGAREGGFAHNTGEGGISRYHLQGGDLIWQIGTGFFGCRTEDGRFDPEAFARQAARPEVRMVELKLSQGAKPGGGGMLPAVKVTPAIAEARGVPEWHTVHSPPAFAGIDSPLALVDFIDHLRELAGGKPIGLKLCVGRPVQFVALCKAMLERGSGPDYLAVDGSEGGTGAAPLELSNAVGTPLREGLLLAHNVLVGSGLRERVRVIASGKVVDGFDIASRLAIGADACHSARAMMFAMGCIQARRCHRNNCPTGITTHRHWRERGLDIDDKARRVARYHQRTIEQFLRLLAAAGLHDPDALTPDRIWKRTSLNTARSYRELYEFIEPGALVAGDVHGPLGDAWRDARPDHF